LSGIQSLKGTLIFLTSHISGVFGIAEDIERAQEVQSLVLGLNHSEAPEKNLLDGHSAKTNNDEQTALDKFQNAWNSLFIQFKTRWLSRELEHKMVLDRDKFFRLIRENKIALGVHMRTSEYTTKLEDIKVIHVLKCGHEAGVRYDKHNTVEPIPTSN
jgi:hypothetical protein